MILDKKLYDNDNNKEKQNIAIIGAGGMGTALSVLLCQNGHNVRLWSKFGDEVDMLRTCREQKLKLPGVQIPNEVNCTTDLKEALDGAHMAVVALPSQTIRNNIKEMSAYFGLMEKKLIVNCSKGLEEATCKLISDVIAEEAPGFNVVVLSGPSHAEEIARGIPTAVVASSASPGMAEHVQDVFMAPGFRVYTNPDVTGVELGGAVKNIIALCAGICDGLGFGDNTKAALMTRGIAEITRLGTAMGADQRTFYGLSGIGDLIVTCTSMHSRNRRAGILIGKGKTASEALAEVNMVVEGIASTKPVYELSRKMSIPMPITEQAYEVIYNAKAPALAVRELMTRDRKSEIE